MNRRRFLQALFAVPALAAPLLVVPRLAWAAKSLEPLTTARAYQKLRATLDGITTDWAEDDGWDFSTFFRVEPMAALPGEGG